MDASHYLMHQIFCDIDFVASGVTYVRVGCEHNAFGRAAKRSASQPIGMVWSSIAGPDNKKNKRRKLFDKQRNVGDIRKSRSCQRLARSLNFLTSEPKGRVSDSSDERDGVATNLLARRPFPSGLFEQSNEILSDYFLGKMLDSRSF